MSGLILTTEEAAEQVGVTPATIRQWVMRGHLEPVRRGAHPLRFHLLDVARCHADRQSREYHDTLRRRWRQARMVFDPEAVLAEEIAARKSDQERVFWAKVDKRGPDECWLWQGYTLNSGYGRVTMGGVSLTAHRAAWQIEHQQLVPRHLVVDHLCCTPLCVNPRHLEPVSNAENLRRARTRRAGVVDQAADKVSRSDP